MKEFSKKYYALQEIINPGEKNTIKKWYQVFGDKMVDLIKFSTNLSVVVAIIFGIVKINQAEKREKVEITMQLIEASRTPEFLAAFQRVKTEYYKRKDVPKIQFSDSLNADINTIINTSDNIAVLYMNDFVDKCVIKVTIKHALDDLFLILDKIDLPQTYLENLNVFNQILENTTCNN